MWNCKAELDPLIAEAHPAEELLIRQIEAEAADIRRRWFAAVRLIYAMDGILILAGMILVAGVLFCRSGGWR